MHSCAVLCVLSLLACAVAAHSQGLALGSKAASQIPLKTCYDDMLFLQDIVPTLSRDIRPLMLSKVRLNTKLNRADHLSCYQQAPQQRPQHLWPTTFTRHGLTFETYNRTSAWTKLQKSCPDGSVPGLSIAIARNAPLTHFGHRMLSELPALFALRLFLVDKGIDISQVRVVYTDALGHPAWGPANFKPIINSLGYHSYEPSSSSMICFDHVILMPVTWYTKWYTNPEGKPLNMWAAPEMLYDADPFHIGMIEHIRKYAFGLPGALPFAPAFNRTVVLASRDPKLRQKFKFRMKRLLLNEDELFEALKTLKDTRVVRVEMGAMNSTEVVRLLSNTSLFLGYHGAAFDNLAFLPRGAAVLEILPMGTNHPPLYPAIAHRTGKEFARYVNDDPKRQSDTSLQHYANLKVDVKAVMVLVDAMLKVQQAAMRRYSFDGTDWGTNKNNSNSKNNKTVNSTAN